MSGSRLLPAPLALGFACAISSAAPSTSSAPSAPDEVVAAAAAGPAATLADLAFLSGSWVADWNGSRLEEHFTAPRDGTIVGMFRWSADGATTVTEHMTIEQRDDGVHFFLRHFGPGAEIWAQEADGPMAMRLVEAAPARAVFADPQRAFPRRIVYHRTRPDTLVARLEGHRDSGEPREMEFVYRSTSMSTSTESLTAVGQSLDYNGGLTIAFQVKDIAKSIDWYQNVLGFKLLYQVDEIGWCELSTSVDKVAIGLSQVEAPKTKGPVPTFGVNDIDRARKQLEDKKVKFDGETVVIPDMVKLATFYDPDGNALMFYQSLAPTP